MPEPRPIWVSLLVLAFVVAMLALDIVLGPGWLN